MISFYNIINGLYCNDTACIIHTLNKYSLCHVEEVEVLIRKQFILAFTS